MKTEFKQSSSLCVYHQQPDCQFGQKIVAGGWLVAWLVGWLDLGNISLQEAIDPRA